MMKRTIFGIILIASALAYAQLPVGATRKTVTTDENGNVINTPLAYSNQFKVYVSATNQFEPIIVQQFTNTIYGVTNRIIGVPFGGTGNGTTLLSGFWTNSINFRVNGTNSANAYSVHGQLGFSGNVTNMVATGLSNVVYYSDGIVTNRTTIP